MRVGQARKRDANEAKIVAALEAIGVTVLRLSGASVPDLLTFKAGRWLPLEVKAPGGSLTPLQAILHESTNFPIVETVDEALAVFEVSATGRWVRDQFSHTEAGVGGSPIGAGAPPSRRGP